MTQFNDDPRPRALFFLSDEQDLERMKALVPTGRQVDWTTSVEETEWDLAVTTEHDAGSRAAHLHVLSFGASTLDMVATAPGASTRFSLDYETYAEGLEVPPAVNAQVRALIAESIVPNLVRGEAKKTWGYTIGRQARVSTSIVTGDLQDRCDPLLHVGPEKRPLAIEYRRDFKSSGPLGWALPEETTHRVEWFALFLRRLREVHPESFPADPEWQRSSAWGAPQVLAIGEQIDHLRQARVDLLARSDRELAISQAAQEKALDESRHGPLHLLTQQGQPLVDAVISVLRDLGFEVTEMDKHHETTHGRKFEDLQVRDPDDRGCH